MREIKFRAWNAPEKHMVYSDPMPDMSFWKYVAYDSTTPFMQYTGLKNGDGIEIYEGDILNDHDKAWYVVEFRVAAFVGVAVRRPGQRGRIKQSDEVLAYMPGMMKVIGNLYENPELLGATS